LHAYRDHEESAYKDGHRRLGVADLFRNLLIIVTGFIVGIKGVRPVRARFHSSPQPRRNSPARGKPLEIGMGLPQPLLGAFQQSRGAMHVLRPPGREARATAVTAASAGEVWSCKCVQLDGPETT
jgi:hypothetical protein